MFKWETLYIFGKLKTGFKIWHNKILNVVLSAKVLPVRSWQCKLYIRSLFCDIRLILIVTEAFPFAFYWMGELYKVISRPLIHCWQFLAPGVLWVSFPKYICSKPLWQNIWREAKRVTYIQSKFYLLNLKLDLSGNNVLTQIPKS